jgi:hypothetical protein
MKYTSICSVALAALLVLTGSPSWSADLADAFELDGNALDDDGAGGKDDWQTLLNSNATPPAGSGAQTVTKVPVTEADNVTIFAGGDKDIKNYPDMGWTDGSVPDKDDITNAAAAAYQVNGDLVIYFAADRYATAGDAFIGAWFHKDSVSLGPNGTFIGEKTGPDPLVPGSFGDILVLVNFENGGVIPTVVVLEWDPIACPKKDSGNSANFGVGDCPGDNLQILFKEEAKCDPAGPNKTACAITNPDGELAAWTFQTKSGGYGPGVYPLNSFFEGGINISQLLGTDQCFASFLIETRSSSSETAQLKDFLLGEFPLCKVTLSKACSQNNVYDPLKGYIPVPYTIYVKNDGFGPIPANTITVTDDNCTAGNTGDDVTTTISAELGASGTATDTAEIMGECKIYPPFTGQPVNGVMADAGDIDVVLGTCDATSGDWCFAQCGIDTSPSIAVNKFCTTRLDSSGGVVKVVVDFKGEVLNDSNTGANPVPTPLKNVTVKETAPVAGSALTLYSDDAFTTPITPPVSLEPGAKAYFKGTYTPSAPDNASATCAKDASFTDTVKAEGEDTFTGTSTSQTDNATCNLCVDCPTYSP